MLAKSAIAAGAMISALAMFQPAPAQASNVSIHFGIGAGGPVIGFGHYGVPPRGHWRGHRLSCGQAMREVQRSGFRHVRALSCNGRTYVFAAQRHHRRVNVLVDARSGRIVAVRRA